MRRRPLRRRSTFTQDSSWWLGQNLKCTIDGGGVSHRLPLLYIRCNLEFPCSKGRVKSHWPAGRVVVYWFWPWSSVTTLVHCPAHSSPDLIYLGNESHQGSTQTNYLRHLHPWPSSPLIQCGARWSTRGLYCLTTKKSSNTTILTPPAVSFPLAPKLRLL